MTYRICDFCGLTWPSNKLVKRKGRYICPLCWDEGEYQEFRGVAEEEPEGLVVHLGWWINPQNNDEEGILLLDERLNLNVMSNVENGMILTYEPVTAPLTYFVSSPFAVVNDPFVSLSSEEEFYEPGWPVYERQPDGSFKVLEGETPPEEGILIFHEYWPMFCQDLPEEGILIHDEQFLYEGLEEQGIIITTNLGLGG